MAGSNVRMGIGLWGSRFGNPKILAELARTMEATGHVDQMVFWDQLTNWWPQALWDPAFTPLAKHFPDTDSFADPFIACAFALAGVEKMGFAICTDALRRDPPELAQMLLTLALATEGQATLNLGAGEVRHIAPFGRKRSIGLKRLEDALPILRLLLKERGLVNFQGKVWELEQAWLGNGGKDRAPEVTAMGGGPRLIEASLNDADGFSSGAPFVFANADQYGEAVRSHRAALSERGRGDEPYTYGLHHIAFLCKDRADFEQYVDNPLVKWYAATGGRLNMADWAEEGIESVMPLDWHYAFHMKPSAMSRSEVMAVVDKVTPEMVRKTFFYGSPRDIAEQVIPYARQGANLNMVADLSPLMVETDPFESITQMADMCRIVKEAVA